MEQHASNCQKLKPINGACNNTVRKWLHNWYKPNDLAVGDTSTLYKWSCVGQQGGTTASNCPKNSNLLMERVTIQFEMAAQLVQPMTLAVGDTSTLYKWSCVGQQGGTTASNCQKLKPINGACNNTVRKWLHNWYSQ